MIRRILIQNFKSLTKVEADLGAFTVLIGRNGAGKSAFLQALSVLSWLVRYKSINETFEREGVSFNDLVSLKARSRRILWACDVALVGFEAPVMMTYRTSIGKRHYVYVEGEVALPTGTPNFAQARDSDKPNLGRDSNRFAWAHEGAEKVQYQGAVIAHSLLQEVREQTLFGKAKFPVLGALAEELAGFRHFQIWGPESLRDESSGKETALSEKGRNLPSVIADLKVRRSELDSYDKLLKDMRGAYPWLEEIEVRHFPAGKVGLAFLEKPEVGSKRGSKRYSPSQVSDGFLRLLALTALRYQRGKVSILGYEEPENGLHPQLLEQSVNQLRKIAEAGTQVIVTTHSPYLLDYLMETPEGELKADLKVVVRGKDGATKILPVSEKKLAEARAQGIRAGELWSLLVDERELVDEEKS